MQLILQGAEINEWEMVLEIRTGALVGATDPERSDAATRGKLRSEPPVWLPGLVSHRTLRFSFKCQLPSLLKLRHREKINVSSVAQKNWSPNGGVYRMMA